MINNREFVYQIRKHLPGNQALHDFLAKRKLNEYKKLLIPEEYVVHGEKDPTSVPEIIDEFEKRRPAQIKKLTDSFDDYLKKAGIKFTTDEYSENRIKMLFNCLAYGFAPDEYMYYKLKDKSAEEKKTYVTDIDRTMLQYIMSDFKDLLYVFDKSATYEKLRKYYQREQISISSKKDFEKFKAFALKHDELVIKQVSMSCGQGVQIEKTDIENLEQQFASILSRGKSSIEEKIIQSVKTSCFNETSVNTIRVITFNTKHGIKICSCFFKTGRKGSIVDNAGAGGIIAGINNETGVIDSDGIDEYLNQYLKHPNSGVIYKGYQLPDWNNCIQMINEMCNLLPKVGYIGWDLAFTDNGWVLVEANGGSQFVGPQLAYNRGFKPEVEKYIADRNIY